MPTAAQKIDPLNGFHEGVVRTDRRAAAPIPLKSTKIDVAIKSGFATVSTIRVFRNEEESTIEATMTFPVPVDSVVHGVSVNIDGRRLIAVAQATEKARVTYEGAIDAGKTAVLHEEKLKGVHMLSIAHIPPGKEVAVEVIWSKPLSYIGDVQTLRIPTTVAEIYGRSPLIASDDLIVHDSIVFDAALSVTIDSGSIKLAGAPLTNGSAEIKMNQPIILSITEAKTTTLTGHTADGRSVEMTVTRGPTGEAPLRAEILFDNSGSTNDLFDGESSGASVWERSKTALQDALTEIVADDDRIALSQFNNYPTRLGEATGSKILDLTRLLRTSSSGTEIGAAIASANAEWATDVVLITDGRSHALDIHHLASNGKRISVVLCGANGLEAHVGHLAALTGGIIVVAGADNIEAAIKTVFGSLRTRATPPGKIGLQNIPATLTSLRGGAIIKIAVSDKTDNGAPVDAIGAYTAFLALPLLSKEAAATIAAAHGLCTHLTSLIVVDEASKAQEGLPNQRKVPLSAPIESSMSYMASATRLRMSAGNTRDVLRFMAPSDAQKEHFSPMLVSANKSFGGDGTFESLSDTGLFTPAPFLDTPSFKSEPITTSNLAILAKGIDWGAHATELARGSTDALDGSTKRAISAALSDTRIIVLATALGITTTHVVIALLAKNASDGNRNAARIARLVFDKADQVLVNNAMKALGL